MANSRADYEQWKRYQEYRRENPRTFHEFIADFTLTLEEQRELVTYLAHLRYEATIKTLMPCLRSPEIDAADAIRDAQKAYMADRGNEEKGRAVAAAAENYDRLRSR